MIRPQAQYYMFSSANICIHTDCINKLRFTQNIYISNVINHNFVFLLKQIWSHIYIELFDSYFDFKLLSGYSLIL